MRTDPGKDPEAPGVQSQAGEGLGERTVLTDRNDHGVVPDRGRPPDESVTECPSPVVVEGPRGAALGHVVSDVQ